VIASESARSYRSNCCWTDPTAAKTLPPADSHAKVPGPLHAIAGLPAASAPAHAIAGPPAAAVPAQPPDIAVPALPAAEPPEPDPRFGSAAQDSIPAAAPPHDPHLQPPDAHAALRSPSPACDYHNPPAIAAAHLHWRGGHAAPPAIAYTSAYPADLFPSDTPGDPPVPAAAAE
jgi:hypothetical protein